MGEQGETASDSFKQTNSAVAIAFSYGDWYIDMVADRNMKHGSPGTWELADMNHYLEYTASLMPGLVEKVHEIEDEVSLSELLRS